MIRRSRRNSRRKALVPIMLALALVFSSVISVGFAAWQDKMTIVTDVSVNKRITVSAQRNSVYQFSNGTYDQIKTGDTDALNWVCYVNSENATAIGGRSVMAYEIPAAWSGSQDGGVFTVYNSMLDSERYSGRMQAGTPATETTNVEIVSGVNGIYRKIMKASSVTFGNSRYALDPDPNTNSYRFHAVAEIPVQITLTNTNVDAVEISEITVHDSGEADVSTNSLTIAAGVGNTASITVTPNRDTETNQYTNFYITFKDNSGYEYRVDVVFDKSTTATMSAGRTGYSLRPSGSAAVNSAATTTTTTTADTADSTTAAEQTTARSETEKTEETKATEPAETSVPTESTTAAEQTTAQSSTETEATTAQTTASAAETTAETQSTASADAE